MSDLIRLLPDAVANQIAAGEVIQRPSSAVKELVENAVDAGATLIKVNIKDAGKSLIQITDNGCGMSGIDARMCFERHATSKIQSTDDLFSIRTLGFRGEALASIAAIAQVELKTRQAGTEHGSEVIIEGAKVISQSACACADGTSVAVKNLFFNVPARRNFLKSDSAEYAHIIEEFFRLALVHPEITFILHNNGKEQYHLAKANLKQRIIQLFGNNYSERIVNINASTDLVNINGFTGKPEFAKKTRGEQYFFVNSRYIRHPFFHHAVETAYKELIPQAYFPSYFIYFTVNPANLDVNIHPTKTEVKFLNDRIIYSMLLSTVKQGLGRFSLTPSIDFDVEQSLDLRPLPPGHTVKPPEIRVNPDYNPFHPPAIKPRDPLESPRTRSNREHWEALFQQDTASMVNKGLPEENTHVSGSGEERLVYQLKNQYIITSIKSGMMVIDQHRAHQRILFEQLADSFERQEALAQQELFPHTLSFSGPDAAQVSQLVPDLRLMGFNIEPARHNKNSFVVSGVPANCPDIDIQTVLEEILDHFKSSGGDTKSSHFNRLASAMSRSLAIRPGKTLSVTEMNNLLDGLFACHNHEYTPDGRLILTVITLEELAQKFK